jgi:ribosomal protein S27AE
MTPESDDTYSQVRHELAAWHALHPRATLADIEAATEEQINRLRADLIAERIDASFTEERPFCAQCGATMQPRSQNHRTVILRGDQALPLARSYVVCPDCGAGLFPPG